MTTLELTETGGGRLVVALMQGCAEITSDCSSIPAGHRLSRARIRHIAQSERIAVTAGTRSVGLAAYKKADSNVRVVHEFLVSRRLDDRGHAIVIDMILTAMELLFGDDGIQCLMVLLGPDVHLAPFEQHGYTTLITDSTGVWLQKRLDTAPWITSASHHLH